MSVVCNACSTRNRDGAKFCLGCARRLPDFVPGPVVEAWPPVVARPDRGVLALLPAEKPAFWIALGLLVLAMGAAFIGWYFPMARNFRLPEIEAVFRVGQQAEAPPRAATASPPEAARPVPPARPEPAAPEPAAPEPIAQAKKLAPVETIPVTPPPPVQHVKADAAQKEASAPPPSMPSRGAQAAGAGDPMRACANLDYLSMNRCASEQCDKPQFQGHPRCETVRAQRWQREQVQPDFAQSY
ncbi:MAG: hypothetical protein EOP82_20810 [Variovorax sp.]|nr:MAG: hypothetical protein EOP82_20810 [Variovorax sp.]